MLFYNLLKIKNYFYRHFISILFPQFKRRCYAINTLPQLDPVRPMHSLVSEFQMNLEKPLHQSATLVWQVFSAADVGTSSVPIVSDLTVGVALATTQATKQLDAGRRERQSVSSTVLERGLNVTSTSPQRFSQWRQQQNWLRVAPLTVLSVPRTTVVADELPST